MKNNDKDATVIDNTVETNGNDDDVATNDDNVERNWKYIDNVRVSDKYFLDQNDDQYATGNYGNIGNIK